MLEQFANNAITTLTVAIDSIETTIQVDDISLFPADGQFRIKIESEIALVTAVNTISGDFFFTVSRGIENTSPVAHNAATQVIQILTAEALLRLPRAMESLGDVEYLNSSGDPTRLAAPGTNGRYVLKFVSSVPSYESRGMTNAGDLEYFSGTVGPVRFAAPGTTGLYGIAWTGSVPTWTAISFETLPIGTVLPYSGGSAPNSNYAICDGSAISRSTYATLFSIIGVGYGAGNGTTTFNIPDLRNRFPFGAGSFAVLGQAFGSTDHTHAVPSHSHTVDTSNHTHGFTTSNDGTHIHTLDLGTDYERAGGGNGVQSGATDSGGDHNHTGTTDSAGGESLTTSTTGVVSTGAANPPALTLNFIIKLL